MALEVIGVGLGRTGTLSLKGALEKLGFGPCYHMIELRAAKDGFQRWMAHVEGQVNWQHVFEGFRSTSDHPGCDYWRELSADYPKAKLVLTVRDPDAWFDSGRTTVFSDDFYRMLERAPESVQAFFRSVGAFAFFEAHRNDRAAMTDYFRQHNQAIIDTIDPDRLLVFEAGQGWEPLCKFLEVPGPEIPFPRINERAMLEEELRRAAAGELNPAQQQRDLLKLIADLRSL
jgi:Sulfotransferase domain